MKIGGRMNVYEFGVDRTKTFAMFPCTAEPWWAFRKSAGAMAAEYHVFLFIPDGHDESGTDFVSIEKIAEDAACRIRGHEIREPGVSMGAPMADLQAPV